MKNTENKIPNIEFLTVHLDLHGSYLIMMDGWYGRWLNCIIIALNHFFFSKRGSKVGRLLQTYHRLVCSTQKVVSIKFILSFTSTCTWATLHIKRSHPCQSERELKGQRIQSGTRHAQPLIFLVWEMMTFRTCGQLELKLQNGSHNPLMWVSHKPFPDITF